MASDVERPALRTPIRASHYVIKATREIPTVLARHEDQPRRFEYACTSRRGEEAFNNLFSLLNYELLGHAFRKLNSKLRGHYQYYGVNDNWSWLCLFRRAAVRLALRWLRRRSQKSTMSHTDFRSYLTRYPIVNPQKLLNLHAW